MNSKHLKYFLLCISFIACKQATEVPQDNIYGTYNVDLYSNDTLLITKGHFTIFTTDSIKTEGFINIIDSLGVAQNIPDQTFHCTIEADTLEFITAFFPNFGVFLIKGIYSANNISGNWELWGHLWIDRSGLLKAIKI